MHPSDVDNHYRFEIFARNEEDDEWTFLWSCAQEDAAIAKADTYSGKYGEVVVEDSHMSMEEPDHVIYRC